jgi:hypothetical protein
VSTERRRLLLRLGAGVALAAIGAAIHSWFVVGCGLGLIAVVGALRLWARRSSREPAQWPAAVVLTTVAFGLVVLSIWVLIFMDAPVLTRLGLGLAGLIPTAYFAFMAWGVSYFAITGRRAPGADRALPIFSRLNEPIWRRNKRK